MKKSLMIIIVLVILFLLGFLRVWSYANIFGEKKINSYELFGRCWQGDIRLCDYDPFD